MRGIDGVYSNTKLVRRTPFGEWVTVYFDPKKTGEKQLLAAIRKKNCPRAQQVSAPYIRTPFVAPGDPVQLEVPSGIERIDTPAGWEHLPGTPNILLPANARSATVTVRLTDGRTVTARVEVVTRVGP